MSSTPSRASATAFLTHLSARLGGELGLAPRTIADRLKGANFSDLEQFALDVRRRYVLSLPEADTGPQLGPPQKRPILAFRHGGRSVELVAVSSGL